MATILDPEPAASPKPRLRGRSHEWAFFLAIGLGVALVSHADTAGEVFALSVYAAGFCGLFGVSALYHRVTWTPGPHRWMRRADHAMIFVFIAASYTPFGLLVLDGTMAAVLLVVVWAGAIGGVVLNLLWADAPQWVTATIYVALGWTALGATPAMLDALGVLPVLGIALGGVLYTAGAVVYARGRPDPAPAIFGFHEIFHLLVIAAALAHYSVIAFAVV